MWVQSRDAFAIAIKRGEGLGGPDEARRQSASQRAIRDAASVLLAKYRAVQPCDADPR